MKTSKHAFSILFLMTIFCSIMSTAQINLGAGIASRYVWRGVDYGNSPSVQPSLSYRWGGLTVGTWGAYSFAGVDKVFSEHDVWVSYDLQAPSGMLSLLFTDYYYPSAGLKYFNYSGSGRGSHTLELGLAFAGPGSLPLAVKALVNVHNDPDQSVYLEVSYPVVTEEATLNLLLGMSGSKSAWYGTRRAAAINAGLSAVRAIALTEHYSLPVSASFLINPDLEQSYLIFSISF